MHAMPLGRLNRRFSRNGWELLGIGQLECVSYGVVYGVSYCVGSEKALISEDDRQEHELRVKLCKLIVKTRPGRFLNVFFPLHLCMPPSLFYAFRASIYRTTYFMRHGLVALNLTACEG
jgi:hypothetical protein